MSSRPVEPPVELPPGRVVHAPGVGELFVRDSGGDGPPVLLLHGWMFAADANWWPVYRPLEQAGHRVLALDHRGHGRGLRSPEPFRLLDCARDAAALLDALGTGPVVAVGYSMGGPVAQLLARERPDLVRALVLCATAPDWQDPHLKAFWRTMALLRLALGLFPTAAWNASLRGISAMSRPGRALNHCWSRSIRVTHPIGVPQIEAASRARSSNSFSGAVFRRPYCCSAAKRSESSGAGVFSIRVFINFPSRVS